MLNPLLTINPFKIARDARWDDKVNKRMKLDYKSSSTEQSVRRVTAMRGYFRDREGTDMMQLKLKDSSEQCNEYTNRTVITRDLVMCN